MSHNLRCPELIGALAPVRQGKNNPGYSVRRCGVIALKRKLQSKQQKLVELDTSSPSRLQLTVNSCQENADQCQIVDAKEDPLTVAGASSFNKKSSPLDIDKLMTETSSQEFFEILDGASAEDSGRNIARHEFRNSKRLVQRETREELATRHCSPSRTAQLLLDSALVGKPARIL